MPRRRKKYHITKEFKEYDSYKVYRIKASNDIPIYNIKRGDFGGWIQNEFNLSQEGTCWVGDEAIVIEDARILGKCFFGGNAVIRHNRVISEDVKIIEGDFRTNNNNYIPKKKLKPSTAINRKWVIAEWMYIKKRKVKKDKN